jgi:hypothetical protein
MSIKQQDAEFEYFTPVVMMINIKIRTYSYKTIILPVVLYGCETCLILTKEHREDWALRRIYAPKKVEATGQRRELHNEKLHDLFCSPSIIRIIRSRRMRWTGHVAEGKSPLGRPICKWMDKTKMDLGETGWGGVE